MRIMNCILSCAIMICSFIFSQIGHNERKNCCKKVEEIENAYRQTDEAVDEDLEKIIINLDSSLDTDVRESEYSSGEMTETSSETEACLQLG